MALGTLFSRDIIEKYKQEGYWSDELVSDFWYRNAAEYPDEEALLDSRIRLTWSKAVAQFNRLALALLELGLERDDAVLVQLYNCAEHVLLRLACERAGITFATAMPTFRQAEIEPILKHVEAVGVVIPWQFRGFDYFEMIQRIRPHVPSLKYIFVTGDRTPPGTISIDEMTRQPLEEKYPADYLSKKKYSAFDVSRVTTTSGTTGIPKCGESPACVRICSAREYVRRLKLSHNDVVAIFAPLPGGGGDLLGYHCSPLVAAKLVLAEHFSTDEACQLIEREKVTVAGMVPAMINRLLSYPGLEKHDISSLRLILSSTTLLNPALAMDVESRLGCTVADGYGAADVGAISVSIVDDPLETRLGTVSKPLEGVKIRLVDYDGNEVPRGEAGRVMVSGPHCQSGYYKNAKATYGSWKGQWFDMGEMGRWDALGNLVLLGRKRDTIIRGGQNIYPKEIEDLLMKHPKVADVTIVGMPDIEMGEKACAYVVPKLGQSLIFDEMVSFLMEQDLAKFKLPERLEIVDSLPMVANQKVDKQALYQDILQKLKRENKI